MSAAAKTIERPTATVHLWGGAHGNTVRISGVVREATAETWLIPLLWDVHRTALEQTLKEVELDIRDLEYANAVLWRCLVGWIKRIRERGSTYNLRVTWNRERKWQEIALTTLRVFAFDPRTGQRVMIEGLD